MKAPTYALAAGLACTTLAGCGSGSGLPVEYQGTWRCYNRTIVLDANTIRQTTGPLQYSSTFTVGQATAENKTVVIQVEKAPVDTSIAMQLTSDPNRIMVLGNMCSRG